VRRRPAWCCCVPQPRYRGDRRRPGAGGAGVRRHPRRAVQVTGQRQPDQHRARHGRGAEGAAAAGVRRRPPWPADSRTWRRPRCCGARAGQGA
jgi:hypothetical protein